MVYAGWLPIELNKFSHEPGPLPHAISVARNYIDQNGYFVTENVWAQTTWTVYIRYASLFAPVREYERSASLDLASNLLPNEVYAMIDNLIMVLPYRPDEAEIFVHLDDDDDNGPAWAWEDDPAWEEHKFQVVGWGMQPSFGITLLSVIIRLLAFKHKVLSRFYASDALGAEIWKRDYEAEF
eukprot:6411820-Prymnesium_polylepis.1